MLQNHRPKNINLPTLLEVLDTLKSEGVADIDIESYLMTPATQWKEGLIKNQSSNVDPTTASSRANEGDLKQYYLKETGKENTSIVDQMTTLSNELTKISGVRYKHDPY